MEHEKYTVMVTDLRGEKPVEKQAAMLVIDEDKKFDIFWDFYLNVIPEQLSRKRGIIFTYKAGEYDVCKKKGKQPIYKIRVTSHTASTPAERRKQTRIVRGTLNVNVI